MSEELKPCPACGSHNVDYLNSTEESETYHFVSCQECLIFSGPIMNSKEEAIAAWNALPRALEWTDEPPKVPGWYWCKHKSDLEYAVVMRVWPEVWAEFGAPNGYDQWAGPIPEPREPK